MKETKAVVRPINILLVEDNPGDARLLKEMLNEIKNEKFELKWAGSLSEGTEHLLTGDVDIVLLDLSLPDSQGIKTFTSMRNRAPMVPIVILSGLADEEFAIRAVKAGAQDYLVKGQVESGLLARAVRYAIERKQAEEKIQRNSQIQDILNKILHLPFQDIPLPEILKQVIDLIIYAPFPWLTLEPKGAIFLVEDEPEVLVLKAQIGLAEPLLNLCARVPFGRCLCGRAALSGKIEFSDCIDERHENRFDGIAPHGHYCVPVMSKDKVVGLINLYSKEGHARSQEEEEFLTAVATTLAGVIERKKLEKELFNASEKWSKTFDSIADLIFIQDENNTITKVNRSFAEAMKSRPEDLIGKKCYKLLHNQDAPWNNCPFEDTKSDMKPHTEEVDDPNIGVPLLVTTSPILDDNGKLKGCVHISKDITERKKLMKELEESKDNFMSIVQKSPGGVVIVNSEGTVDFVNNSAEDLFGRKADDLVGSEFGFPVSEGKAEVDIIRGSCEKGIAEMYVVETSWEGKKNFLISFFDITTIKMAEDTLKEVNRRLHKLNQMKSEFVSVVSHDLRTPLTSIKNAIQLMITGKTGALNDTQKRFMSMAERNIDRLARLINDLLDLSRLEAGKIELRFSGVDIKHLMQYAVETFKPRASERSVQLGTDLPEDLPAVRADSDRIEQVLFNLMDNALKFTPEKGQITVSAENMGDKVGVKVKDTGVGIPADDQRHIFDQFYQVEDSLSRKTQGSGLGLAIVKQMVEAHGGEISVTSQVNKGSSFFFTLPVFSQKPPETEVFEKEIQQLMGNPAFSLIGVKPGQDGMTGAKSPGGPGIWHANQIVEIIRKVITRSSDRIIYHPDFDLLIIALIGTSKKDAEDIKERIVQMFMQNPVSGGAFPAVLGPVCYPDDGAKAGELFKKIHNSAVKT
ncbi:sensor histidine kinase YycG [bacterium BMS3Abin10]|nr:sensor histidine kinase YycG [bacterium BMS3Abin10]GBE39607.1 sensor histidine kinase YycG [bacterium BMS3Bbin08]HDH50589.1 PAS domain S-box protein [Nitrospirota bacterium]